MRSTLRPKKRHSAATLLIIIFSCVFVVFSYGKSNFIQNDNPASIYLEHLFPERVKFFNAPTATLTGGGTICPDGADFLNLEIILTGESPWQIIYEIDGVPQISRTVAASPYQLVAEEPGRYELITVTDAQGCTRAGSGVAVVSELTPLRISELVTDCNSSNAVDDFSFIISGGEPLSYSVTGVSGNISSGPPFLFSSNGNNSSGTPVTFTVSDNSGCESITETIVPDCNCETKIGTMDLTRVEVCLPASATADYNSTNELLDSDDVLGYVLHTEPGFSLGTVLRTNKSPQFSFNAALMDVETTYYISVVAGNNDGSGNVELNDECLKVAAGTPVIFHERLTGVLSGGETVCPDSVVMLRVDLTGAPPFSIQYSDGTATHELHGIAESPFEFGVIPPATSTYRLTSVSNRFCSGTVSGSAPVILRDLPTVSDVQVECDAAGLTFTVEIKIEGGNPADYEVFGDLGTLTGDVFISNPIPTGGGYVFFVSEKTRCAPIKVAAPFVACDCVTEAGTLVPDSLDLCITDPATVVHNGDNISDGNDGLIYAIHDGTENSVGNIVLQSDGPTIYYDENFVTTDVQYYIVALSGNNRGRVTVDLNDTCLAVSNPIPVIWRPQPTADFEDGSRICLGDSANLVLDLTGTGPFDITVSAAGVLTDYSGIDDGFRIRVSPDRTTDYEIVSVNDTRCQNTSDGQVEVQVIAPPEVEFMTDVEICNGKATGNSTVLDFYTLITSGDTGGTWADLNNSGSIGNFFVRDFDGVTSGNYRFRYTTNSAISPCEEAVYEITVIVNECGCPSVETIGSAPLCNSNGWIDLTDLVITTEPGGWSILSAPAGSTATLSGNDFDVTNSPPGDYTLEFSINQQIGNCPTTSTQSIEVLAPPTADILRHGAVCNSNESGNSTLLDFRSLIIGGDNAGTWVDVDNSGAAGSFPVLDFSGLAPQSYSFRYTTASAQLPCSESTYDVLIAVRDCTCPDVSTSPIPPLCIDDAKIDLENYTVTEEPGTWSILSGPIGSTAIVSGNDFDATNAAPGDYILEFRLDQPVSGCPESSTQALRVNALPMADVILTGEVCNTNDLNNQSIFDFSDLIIGGDASGTWLDLDNSNATGSFPSLDFEGVIPGVYRFSYKTGSAIDPCSESEYMVTITVRECKVIVDNSVVDASCFGKKDGSVTFSIQSDSLMLFVYDVRNFSASIKHIGNLISNTQEITIESLPAGRYIIQIYDRWGELEAESLFTVGEPEELTGSTELSNAPSCFDSFDGAVRLEATGGTPDYVFDWSDGFQGIERNDLSKGNYSVEISDINNCKDTFSFQMYAPEPLTANAEGIPVSCSGKNDGQIRISGQEGGTPEYLYAVNDDVFTSRNDFENLEPGIYNVILQDAAGCEFRMDNIEVADNLPLTASLPSEITVFLGEQVTLIPDLNFTPSEINWTPARYLDCSDCENPTLTGTAPITYNLTAYANEDCFAFASVDILIDLSGRSVFIPSAFSPNDDGINDILFVNAGENVTKVKTFKVFGRWGDLIFNSSDAEPNAPEFGWDGTFRGKKVDTGVFTFFAEIEFTGGATEIFEGDVTLFRGR